MHPPYELSPYNCDMAKDIMLYYNAEKPFPIISGDSLIDSSCIENYDISLPIQLPALLEFKPDALVFTEKSAIPLADTFRGIFSKLEIEIPLITTVNPKWTDENGVTHKFSIFENKIFKNIPKHQEDFYNNATELKTKLKGAEKIAVVDQFIATGSTLEISRLLLEEAGIRKENIIPVGGQWYEGLHHIVKLDLINVTSSLSSEMLNIGYEAAEIVRQRQ